MKSRGRGSAAALAVAFAVAALPVFGQGFGMEKTKVVLHRKLPALIQLPGTRITVKVVTVHPGQVDEAADMQSQLMTELLKNDPNLQEDDVHPQVIVNCQITEFAHPAPVVTAQVVPGKNLLGRSQPQTENFTRITGALTVAFQVKTATGRTLTSDNVRVNYDQQFNAAGDNTSHGVLGTMSDELHKIKGGKGTDDQDQYPPTDPELRQKLVTMAIDQMAEQIVNTDEEIEVTLAKGKGALDSGDKEAEKGLWEQALETYMTANPSPKPEDDAYRLYDIGVADEALAYQASDPKAAMKFLDDAAINYGKAKDGKSSEKYFLEPQKRIETAIAHYRKLEMEKNAPPQDIAVNSPPAHPAPGSTPRTHSHEGRALTNSQVVAMVRAGMDDGTVEQTIRNAGAVDFDLAPAARRRLIADGVSEGIISVMRTRAIQELAKGK
jgi:tetratricopeptide (TPR) repeat protein